jgi:hypothetical protein
MTTATVQQLPSLEFNNGADPMDNSVRLPASSGSAVRFEQLLESVSTSWADSEQGLRALANVDHMSMPEMMKFQYLMGMSQCHTVVMSSAVGSVHSSAQSLLQCGGQ